MKTLSFRFDVDTAADIRKGIPSLLDLGRELNVRFSFYINVGKSFSFKAFLARRLKVLLGRLRFPSASRAARSTRVTAYEKLGLRGILETFVWNRDLGVTYRDQLCEILKDGHEMGLHGGMNHAIWQYKLDEMTNGEVDDLFRPAYDTFVQLFGKPVGYCSPGFVYNEHVLDIVDEYGFLYASDMEGEHPFHPAVGDKEYEHTQIPVNVMGDGKASFISQQLALGRTGEEMVIELLEEINRHTTAVLYGHPSIEGGMASHVLRKTILEARAADYRVVPLRSLVS
jgi:peptidoglycan/xylan/chitin deacetylase (PgdA/CDA1 family)